VYSVSCENHKNNQELIDNILQQFYICTFIQWMHREHLFIAMKNIILRSYIYIYMHSLTLSHFHTVLISDRQQSIKPIKYIILQ